MPLQHGPDAVVLVLVDDEDSEPLVSLIRERPKEAIELFDAADRRDDEIE
jgi:hypothetical protein